MKLRYHIEGCFGFTDEHESSSLLVKGNDEPQAIENPTPEQAQEMVGVRVYIGTGMTATLEAIEA